MLQNAYFLAKIGADTAEKEQHFAEILPTDALWRRGGGVALPGVEGVQGDEHRERDAGEERADLAKNSVSELNGCLGSKYASQALQKYVMPKYKVLRLERCKRMHIS